MSGRGHQYFELSSPYRVGLDKGGEGGGGFNNGGESIGGTGGHGGDSEQATGDGGGGFGNETNNQNHFET